MYRQIPFSRLLLPLVVGIILAIKVPLPFNQFHLSIVLAILFVSMLFTFIIRLSWTFRWLFGVLASLFLLISGVLLTLSYRADSKLVDGVEGQYIVRIVEPVEERATSHRALAQVTMEYLDDVWTPIRENVMLYFSISDSIVTTLEYGSIIAVKAKFTSPPKPINPYQFSYKEYLARQQVFRVAFVQSDHWYFLGKQTNWVFDSSYKLRNKMLALFQRMGIEGENLAVLSALTMGYKSLLDDETRRVFSASGAMHILAVSGLHVGILFTTLSAFLFLFSRFRRGKYIKALILVCFLWLFAIFTGLSPSVIRASLMFSLVIIGTAYSRNTNIYNTLSSSAFIILTFNPLLLTDVGFQLSYLAVVSIVFFYPHFYKALYIKNKWIDKIWSLVCVSIAAQLGTFALGLFYFNQFPNYFLLTNLYAIPLAFIILYLAIALMVFSPLIYLNEVLGWLLNESLSVLNSLIRFTENLPFSTSTGISISISQSIFLLLSIIMLALFLEFRKTKFVYGLLAFSLLFFLEQSYSSIRNFNREEVIFFGQRQSSIIGFKKGNVLALSFSDTLSDDRINKYSFSLGGYVNRMGVEPFEIGIEQSDSSKYFKPQLGLSAFENQIGLWFYFKNRSIFIPHSENVEKYTLPQPFPVDILLFTSTSSSNIDKIFELVSPSTVVIDATIPQWKLENLSEKLNLMGVNYHSIQTQGAYILR